MYSPQSRQRDEGLARTASWTRRTAAAGALLCAALAAVFAHALPGQAAARSSTSPGTGTAPAQQSPGHGLRAPAQPPTAGSGSNSGSGSGQVRSGAS
ncbi:hypothetical protein [Kitasatospora sp. MAP5-34]|uniref:hypothetical protein n=1 Tax=Kitasatospora sp. MAP5-34 TaxID=3035102 RepID=UPI002476A47B|nr:hypothetical protein [Kitasatospora sp. MAP5-34]MDH6577742.1 hypothetical protein [Kitasatospora sp. MAP5-34]